MSEHSVPTNRPSGFWPAAIGIIGSFLIFAAILWVVYLPNREAVPSVSQPPDDSVPRTPVARAAALRELMAAQQRAKVNYEVLDATRGVVRLPIERAMELVVAEESANRPN
jgi:hypothetical protein